MKQPQNPTRDSIEHGLRGRRWPIFKSGLRWVIRNGATVDFWFSNRDGVGLIRVLISGPSVCEEAICVQIQ